LVQAFLEMQRVFAPIYPNLHKKVFIWFSANVGRHFCEVKQRWALFLPRFSGIFPGYLRIVFWFSGIFPGYSTNQSFWGCTCAPCLLHHLFNARSFAMPLAKDLKSTGLHNSESWKGKITNINFPRITNNYFISMWRFIVVWKKFWKENCLFEVELSQHFLRLGKPSRATREAFAGRMLCRPATKEWAPKAEVNEYTLCTMLFSLTMGIVF